MKLVFSDRAGLTFVRQSQGEVVSNLCYQESMTVDALDSARRMPAEEAEEYLLTMERLRRFDAARRGVRAEDLRDWMLERRDNPAAPCPKAKPLR